MKSAIIVIDIKMKHVFKIHFEVFCYNHIKTLDKPIFMQIQLVKEAFGLKLQLM